ncbi:MAG: class I SAM-dependent methyltransferase [Nanoarchaeota archaeon]
MKSQQEVTIDSYNQTADDYAANVAGLFLKKDAKSFLSYLSQGSLILDHGCGSGRDAREFTERGYRVMGIDFSEKMIEISRKNAPKAEFRLMNIVEMDFPGNYFDGAWSIASLLHIPKADIPRAIGKVYGCLKAKGVWHMSVKEGEGEVIKPDARYGGVEKFWSFFRKEELEFYLQNANFTVLNSYVEQAGPVSWVNVLCRKQ